MKYKVTGRAWKHHISEDFTKTDNPSPVAPNGAGNGATIFLDFVAMAKFIEEDGRQFHVAELDLVGEELIFNHGTDTIATTTRPILSKEGFVPYSYGLVVNHWAKSDFLCYTVGDEDDDLFATGEIFLSRASLTDYRPHAKQYDKPSEVMKDLPALQAACDIRLIVKPQLIKYDPID